MGVLRAPTSSYFRVTALGGTEALVSGYPYNGTKCHSHMVSCRAACRRPSQAGFRLFRVLPGATNSVSQWRQGSRISNGYTMNTTRELIRFFPKVAFWKWTH